VTRHLVTHSTGEEDASAARSNSPVPVTKPKRVRMNNMLQHCSGPFATSNAIDFYKMMSYDSSKSTATA
jgi:hypothetical protein